MHLFSSPGVDDIRYIVDASRPYLEGRDSPTLAYLPMASLSNAWQAFTEKSFAGLARVELLNTETMTFTEMEAILRKAHVLYIPGGNTFLLNHRLHVSGLHVYLRKKLQAGLPLVAFSAGAVLCGPNIITSRDMNLIPTPYFNGLTLLPFNLHAHYNEDEYKDGWLSDFHVFQPNPVILLEDGAYLRVEGKKTSLVRGDAWILRQNCEKEKLAVGKPIDL